MAGSLLNPSRGLVRNSTFHGRCVALLVLAQLNAILRSVLSDVELSSVSVSLRTSSSLPRAELSVGLQLAMVSNSCTNRDLRLVFPAALTCVDLCSLRSGCRAGSLHTWCTHAVHHASPVILTMASSFKNMDAQAFFPSFTPTSVFILNLCQKFG
uniref:Uncharacterized protein n=1 Tax=Zea mays TaxID=4577 RepID=A0A804RIZ7_MAIZE